MRWAIARRWTVTLPGVILVGDGDLDADQRAQAALLYAGEGAALTGPAAATRYGVRATAESPVVHVVVPATRSVRQVRWVRVTRSWVEDAGVRSRGGLMTCSAARAVLDSARWAPSDGQATALVIEACQRRVTTVAALRNQLELFARAPGTAQARRAVAAAELGAWSLPEAKVAALVMRSPDLSTPWLNPVLSTRDGQPLTSPDMWFDDVGLAVMVHSKAFHQIGDDWTRTVESDGELVAHGATVLGLTPTTIDREPELALARNRRTYVAAHEAGRSARIVARPRLAH